MRNPAAKGPRPSPPPQPHMKLRLIVLVNGDEIEPDSDSSPVVNGDNIAVKVHSMRTVIYKHAIAYLRYW